MRVIAGTLRGRRLVAPRGRGTRPTSDRVREALFSALEPLTGARVLDLYAGSGALAIEALSRGAERAVAVERATAALRALQRNLADLELSERCTVLATPVENALRRIAESGPYDLVLADPPYDDVVAAGAVLDALVRGGAIDGGARLVLEHASRDPAPTLSHAQHVRSRSYGDTAVSSYVAEKRGPQTGGNH